MALGPKKQIHVEISAELHAEIQKHCPEIGQISILTRRLYRSFINHMSIDKAGKLVAERWKEEQE